MHKGSIIVESETCTAKPILTQYPLINAPSSGIAVANVAELGQWRTHIVWFAVPPRRDSGIAPRSVREPFLQILPSSAITKCTAEPGIGSAPLTLGMVMLGGTGFSAHPPNMQRQTDNTSGINTETLRNRTLPANPNLRMEGCAPRKSSCDAEVMHRIDVEDRLML